MTVMDECPDRNLCIVDATRPRSASGTGPPRRSVSPPAHRAADDRSRGENPRPRCSQDERWSQRRIAALPHPICRFLERIAQGKEKLQEGRVLLTTPLELF